MTIKLRIISLGAGVQSSAMALMAAHGEITPMPDCAIFADTQWEPKAVYEHLNWLTSGNVLPFPVYRVTAGNLREAILSRSNTTGGRFAAVPWFIKTVKPAQSRIPIYGDEGEVEGWRLLEKDEIEEGMGRRQCTKEYKIRPVQKKVVDLLNGRPKGGAEVWVGISTDEAVRMKPSKVRYIINRWPLIERRFSRNDCLRWLERRGYPEPPKSSCVGCPFHNDGQWRQLRDSSPDEWQDAIKIDKAIRLQTGFKGEQYMHRSLKPLGEVDLSTPEDHGQLNFFNNECEGMCGV